MSMLIDAFGDSISKYGEELCGNRVEIIRSEDGTAAILADGMGNGVKANMLASLAVKMLSSSINRGEPIEDVVDMLIDRQPAYSDTSMSYSAFTVIQIFRNGLIYTAQLGTPDALFLFHGKPAPVHIREIRKNGSTIRIGETTVKHADTIIAFSSGVVNAGMGGSLKNGWQRENIATYMINAYRPGIPAEKLTGLLLTASSSLDHTEPADDLSVVTLKVSGTNSDD
jgi:hypothetical protein